MNGTKRKNKILTFVLVILLILSIVAVLYPTVSNYITARIHSQEIENYNAAVENIEDEEYASILEAAEEYNRELDETGSESMLVYPDQIEGYENLLDVDGNGLMGYVTIDKIDVNLPIYHGTDSSTLAKGAGHLQGSSLPVGGSGTHAVISAHRGLPSSKFFTDLDKLEIGDTFTITVLNETLTYKVDQIHIVYPSDVDDLYTEDGMDYCTLMTCTPYGINTYRLLVRGVRTETVEEAETAEATRINNYVTAPLFALPLLIILLIIVIVRVKKIKKEKIKEELLVGAKDTDEDEKK